MLEHVFPPVNKQIQDKSFQPEYKGIHSTQCTYMSTHLVLEAF